MEIQITQTDPAYPYINILQDRSSKNVIEISSALYELIHTLHKTSTTTRPPLNGNSRKVVSEVLGVSKGLLSQYLSIHHGIKSQMVQKAIIEKQIGVIRAYYISKSRGKNQEETEKIQLQKINEIIHHRQKSAIKKLVQMKEDVNPSSTNMGE